MTTRLARRSVSVWLPTPVHETLAATAATEGASLPALARRAAAAAAEAAGGRVAMNAPAVEAVAELGAAGDGLHRLLPAADAAASVAQRSSIGETIATACSQIAAAAGNIRLDPPVHGTIDGDRGKPAARWKLVRVTADTAIVQIWKAAAAEAGFGSVANWVRDALAGAHKLNLPRPPAPATTEARIMLGHILGLIAQTETAVSNWPADSVPDEPIASAADALYTALHCLVAHGGDPGARR